MEWKRDKWNCNLNMNTYNTLSHTHAIAISKKALHFMVKILKGYSLIQSHTHNTLAFVNVVIKVVNNIPFYVLLLSKKKNKIKN